MFYLFICLLSSFYLMHFLFFLLLSHIFICIGISMRRLLLICGGFFFCCGLFVLFSFVFACSAFYCIVKNEKQNNKKSMKNKRRFNCENASLKPRKRSFHCFRLMRKILTIWWSNSGRLEFVRWWRNFPHASLKLRWKRMSCV